MWGEFAIRDEEHHEDEIRRKKCDITHPRIKNSPENHCNRHHQGLEVGFPNC